MKTLKITSVIAVAALFFGISAVNAGTPGVSTSSKIGGTLIRYQVNVHIDRDLSLCNIYFVQLTNREGESISTSQRFIPGVNTYTFYEAGPVRAGIRVARLVLGPWYGHYICEPDLWTDPSVMIGSFDNGQTYVFDLYPKSVPPAKD